MKIIRAVNWYRNDKTTRESKQSKVEANIEICQHCPHQHHNYNCITQRENEKMPFYERTTTTIHIQDM